MLEPKQLYKSKTFWFAIVFMIVNLAGVFGYQTYQPDAQVTELVGIVVSITVIVLRYVTNTAIVK